MAGHNGTYPGPGHLAPSTTAEAILTRVHFAYPLVLLFSFLVAFMVHSIKTAPKDATLEAAKGMHGPGGKPLPKTKKRGASAQRDRVKDDFSPAKKAVFNWIIVGVILTFIANSAAVILHALVERKSGWWCGEHAVVYLIGSVTVFSVILVSMVDTAPSPTWAHATAWWASISMELMLFGASLAIFSGKHRHSSPGLSAPTINGMDRWEAIESAINVARLVFLIAVLAFWTFFSWQRSRTTRNRQAARSDPEETTGLLNAHANKAANGRQYGAAQADHPHGQAPNEEEPEDGWKRPEKVPSRTWYEYVRGYSLFFPYLWPARSRKLQLTVLACLVLVLSQRLMNILVPNQSGVIVKAFVDSPGEVPYGAIGLYILFRTLQGNQGLIGALRSVLWIPISQYSYRELSTASFEHVHSLSLDFHLGKKTGEVISALNKGGSINSFLEAFTFNLIPMLVDMFLAVLFFLLRYDAYYALVLFIMAVIYLSLTVRMTSWRTNQRREMVKLDREEEAVKTDSLFSYESVKYFNAEEREFKRYRDAVKGYQKAEYGVLFSLQALNVSQMAVFMIALMITCFLAAYQVVIGKLDVGKFVTLITYMAQLQAPLNFFGTFYRSIQSSMINAERLLELFREQPTVIDSPEAQELTECNGEIQCNDIEFAYDSRHPALKGVTFRCGPGTTTALVGESGGGKSTMFRLLYRFYNLTGGNIEIDGQDVRNLTIDSLRRHIGVVPQDTVLFNETIMYNLKYANPAATDEEVYNACRSASIHDRIQKFPDGYQTKVGERGLKLSGGEKQRVAIARTILKNPRIILLDEATAALDSDTEANIQEALQTLCENRTTIVIAHRLSTITTADQILVLQDGKIAEAGPHDVLVERNGRYATMWRKQIRAQRVAEEARYLTDKAKRLREEVDDSASASQSEDERTSPSSAKAIADKKGHRKQISSLALTARDIDSRDGTGFHH